MQRLEPRRPLTMLDMMALTAASAVGLAAYFSIGADLAPNLNRTHPELMFLAMGVMRAAELTPLFASLSIAILGLYLRPTRPRIRRLARRPGFVPGLAVLISLILGMWFLAPLTIALGLVKSRELVGESAVMVIAVQSGIGVATAWASMAMAGRWRTPKQWLDLAGTALGFYWMALSMALGFVMVTDML